MASIEDKILGGPKENYCSSEESADEQSDSEGDDHEVTSSTAKVPNSRPSASRYNGKSQNTGPKGVVEDWRNFKKLQTEQRSEGERELRELAKRLSKTCRTVAEDEGAREAEGKLDGDDIDDDEFLKAYTQRRISEMMASRNQTQPHRFNVVYELSDADSYLTAADSDSQQSTVLIHLYEPSVIACQTMNGCLACLAKDYPAVKVCRVKASILGTSKAFMSGALPALQAYRNGNLIGNFVRLADEFGEDFFADDVETFLKEYGILPDSAIFSSGSLDAAADGDSDFDVD